MIPALMIRNGVISKHQSLTEFGFYSCVFSDNKSGNNRTTTSTPTGSQEGSIQGQVLTNETFGALMRTKASHSNEGGVNAGYAFIDAPFVVSEQEFKEADADGSVKGTVQI